MGPKNKVTLRDLQILAEMNGIPLNEGKRARTKMQLACELYGPGGPYSINKITEHTPVVIE